MLSFVKTGPPPPVESERNPLGLEDIPMTQISLPDADLAAALDGITTDHFFTKEQFQRDVDYYRAQTIAKTMLDAGLISLVAIRQINSSESEIFLSVSGRDYAENDLINSAFRVIDRHYRREVKP